MKYTYEFKLKAVKSIKKGILIDEPYNKINRQWRDRVKYWEKIYDLHNENGLKRQYRWHTYKEKLDVVKEVIKGNSINQVSINRNVPIKLILDWVNLYRQKGISDLKLVNKRKVLMSKKEKEIKNILKSKDNKSSYTKEEIKKGLSPLEYRQQYFSLLN